MNIIKENDKVNYYGRKIVTTCKSTTVLYTSYFIDFKNYKKAKININDTLFILAFPSKATYIPGKKQDAYFIYAMDKYNNEYHIDFKDTDLSQAKAKRLFKEYFC